MLLDMRVVGRNAPERAGFYSGLIESTFSVAVALAIYPWARLSGAFFFPAAAVARRVDGARLNVGLFLDKVGRKPVLLYGIIGVTVAMVSFGMGNRCVRRARVCRTLYPQR